MFSEQPWRIHVKNLETRMRVGIHPHEREPQRVWVNALVEATYPFRPRDISECFNYEHIHRLVAGEWPQRPQQALLETYVIELLEHIFRCDARVTFARVRLSKPDIFPDAESVGVEAEWTRADFERLTA